MPCVISFCYLINIKNKDTFDDKWGTLRTTYFGRNGPSSGKTHVKKCTKKNYNTISCLNLSNISFIQLAFCTVNTHVDVGYIMNFLERR